MSTPQFEQMSATSQQAVVQITLGQVYNEVQQTHEAVRNLTSALEPIKGTVADHEARLRQVDPLPAAVAELRRDVDGHSDAISSLRIRQALWVGGATVAGVGASTLIAYALHH